MKTLSETQQKRKNVIIYGLKEKVICMRIKRKRRDKI